MMRRWLLVGVTMMMILGGCATDERAARVQFTLTLMDKTKTMVGSIKEKVTAATEQLATDKELNLTEAEKKCDDLKDFCKKEVQKQAEDIRTARLNLTDAQKKEFDEQFKTQVKDKMNALSTETLALQAALKKLEEAVAKPESFSKGGPPDEAQAKQDQAKKAVEALKKKFGEAQAEFETLSRKAQ